MSTLASRESPRQAPRPALSSLSENTVGSHVPQADCFTPKRTPPRSLPRSPETAVTLEPRNENQADPSTPVVASHECKRQGTPKVTYDTGEGSKREVQDMCFTPRRSLKRSPLSRRRSTVLVTQSGDSGASPQLRRSSRGASQTRPKSSASLSVSKRRDQKIRKSATGDASGCEAAHTPTAATKSSGRTGSTDGGTPYEKRIQASCFTPRRSLKRSPHKEQTVSKDDQEPNKSDMMDGIPPPTRWEIPRTPVTSAATHQLTTSTATIAEAERNSSSVGDENDESRREQEVSPQGGSGATPASKVVSPQGGSGATPASKVVSPQGGSGATPASKELQQPSPPITVSKEPTLTAPTGMVYSENDLAYLQRMRNIKQYEQLQTQVAHLDKAIKAAAEQKEQLEHEALKINQDLTDMQTKYYETVSTVHTLISHPSEVRSPRQSREAHPPTTQSPRQLTQAHVAQLKRANQLTAAQLEKTDRELMGKLSEISEEKEKLEMKIREKKLEVEEEKQKFQSQLHSSQEEKRKWEAEVLQAVKEHTAMENELHALGFKLANLRKQSSESHDPAEAGDEGPSLEEKRRAEERLRRIIQRCELYVQRHQMLKEMGIRVKTKH